MVCWVGSVNKGGGRLWQILCGYHSLLFICISGSCTWFLGRRWGLLAPCALEMYYEASIVVTFPCGPRILAEFGMVAFPLCCNFFLGFPYIFCMGLDARIYIPHLSCGVHKTSFCKNYQLCWFFFRYHCFVIFLLLHIRLAFLLCLQCSAFLCWHVGIV